MVFSYPLKKTFPVADSLFEEFGRMVPDKQSDPEDAMAGKRILWGFFLFAVAVGMGVIARNLFFCLRTLLP